MRGRDNYCFGLIDTNIGEREDLSDDEKQDLITMYRCISLAVEEFEQEFINDTKKEYLSYEKQSNDKRLNYIFDRIWYIDICQRIKQIPNEKLQEFITNKSQWNDQTKQILSTISRIIKKKEINPSDVIRQKKRNFKFIYLFLYFSMQIILFQV